MEPHAVPLCDLNIQFLFPFVASLAGIIPYVVKIIPRNVSPAHEVALISSITRPPSSVDKGTLYNQHVQLTQRPEQHILPVNYSVHALLFSRKGLLYSIVMGVLQNVKHI